MVPIIKVPKPKELSPKPPKWYKAYKVIYAVVVEWEGQTSNGAYAYRGSNANAKTFAKVRPYIIIMPKHRHCEAIPITTHGGKGVSSVEDMPDYGIVYSHPQSPPEFTSYESNNGAKHTMLPKPIRLKLDVEGSLHPASRLHYGKLQSIDYRTPVLHCGWVDDDFREDLVRQFLSVRATPMMTGIVSMESAGNPLQRSTDSPIEGSGTAATSSEKAPVVNHAQPQTETHGVNWSSEQILASPSVGRVEDTELSISLLGVRKATEEYRVKAKFRARGLADVEVQRAWLRFLAKRRHRRSGSNTAASRISSSIFAVASSQGASRQKMLESFSHRVKRYQQKVPELTREQAVELASKDNHKIAAEVLRAYASSKMVASSGTDVTS